MKRDIAEYVDEMSDMSKDENCTSTSSREIVGFRDSYLEMGFNFNGFCCGIAIVCFDKECHFGHHLPIHDPWDV